MSREKLEQLLSEDLATEQFDLFLEYYEIDLDDLQNVRFGDNEGGENAKAALEFSKKKIIKAIQYGRLEIVEDEDGRVFVDQKLVGKYKSMDHLRYKPLSAKAKVAMGKKKETHGQIYALLASLSGEKPESILNLHGPDLSLAENLGGFFLVS